jgi:hypothetical protein
MDVYKLIDNKVRASGGLYVSRWRGEFLSYYLIPLCMDLRIGVVFLLRFRTVSLIPVGRATDADFPVVAAKPNQNH